MVGQIGTHRIAPVAPPFQKLHKTNEWANGVCKEKCAELLRKILVPLQKEFFVDTVTTNYGLPHHMHRNKHTFAEWGKGELHGRRIMATNRIHGMLVCCGDDINKPLFFGDAHGEDPRFYLKAKWVSVYSNYFKAKRVFKQGLEADEECKNTEVYYLSDDHVAEALCSVLRRRGCTVLSVWAVFIPTGEFRHELPRGDIADVFYGDTAHTHTGRGVQSEGEYSTAFKFVKNCIDNPGINWPSTRDTLYAARLGSIRATSSGATFVPSSLHTWAESQGRKRVRLIEPHYHEKVDIPTQTEVQNKISEREAEDRKEENEIKSRWEESIKQHKRRRYTHVPDIV